MPQRPQQREKRRVSAYLWIGVFALAIYGVSPYWAVYRWSASASNGDLTTYYEYVSVPDLRRAMRREMQRKGVSDQAVGRAVLALGDSLLLPSRIFPLLGATQALPGGNGAATIDIASIHAAHIISPRRFLLRFSHADMEWRLGVSGWQAVDVRFAR